MKSDTAENCIRHEATYRGASVYTVVVMDGDCPREVSVSVVFGPFDSVIESMQIKASFRKWEELVNLYLASRGDISPFIKMLISPPSNKSKIIADALIAAMEGR